MYVSVSISESSGIAYFAALECNFGGAGAFLLGLPSLNFFDLLSFFDGDF